MKEAPGSEENLQMAIEKVLKQFQDKLGLTKDDLMPQPQGEIE